MSTYTEKEFALDEWDIKLIQHFKRWPRSDIEEVQNIWRERCALPRNYECRQWIGRHLLIIIDSLRLCSMERFVEMLNPDEAWKYDMGKEAVEAKNFWWQVIAVAGSVLSLTEVSKLPGYVRWLEEKTL